MIIKSRTGDGMVPVLARSSSYYRVVSDRIRYALQVLD